MCFFIQMLVLSNFSCEYVKIRIRFNFILCDRLKVSKRSYQLFALPCASNAQWSNCNAFFQRLNKRYTRKFSDRYKKLHMCGRNNDKNKFLWVITSQKTNWIDSLLCLKLLFQNPSKFDWLTLLKINYKENIFAEPNGLNSI